MDFDACEKPLFSVGIPAYNSVEYLPKCLESVSSQTLQKFELIIVDDGSTEATGLLCDKFAHSHNWVVVLHKNNEGPLLARRDIAKTAQGKYVVFLDADDCLRKDALEICAAIIQRHSPDILAFDYSTHEDFSNPMPGTKLNPGFFAGPQLQKVRESVCKGEMNNVCFKAIRLALFDQDEDYSEYVGFKHGEDLFQFLPVINMAQSFFYINECLYYYRRSDSSETCRFSHNQLHDLHTVSERMEEYGNIWGMHNEAKQGIIMQYCYLLNILGADKSLSRKQREDVFQNIRRDLLKTLDSVDSSKYGFNLPLVVDAVAKGKYKKASMLLDIGSLLKIMSNRLL